MARTASERLRRRKAFEPLAFNGQLLTCYEPLKDDILRSNNTP